MFTKEEQAYLEEQQRIIDNARAERDEANKNLMNQAMALQEEEKQRGMVKEQLDLSEELMTLKHLLHGMVLEEKEDGSIIWVTKDDLPELQVLSDYGVYLIMDAVISHTTKNTLLTNLDEPKINRLMLDFSEDLNDTVFMESEKVFKYPTMQECKDELVKRIKKKTDLRKFALEMMGQESNEVELKEHFIKEMENKIEIELHKIKENLMKNKYKRFLMLMRIVRDFVEFSLNRAYRGEERRTLRQHIHVSENINPNPMPQPQKKGGLFGFGGRR